MMPLPPPPILIRQVFSPEFKKGKKTDLKIPYRIKSIALLSDSCIKTCLL